MQVLATTWQHLPNMLTIAWKIKSSRMTTPELNDCQQRWLPLQKNYNLKNEICCYTWINPYVTVRVCCIKRFACNTTAFFGCQPSSSDPICVSVENKKEGGGRGRWEGETVHLDFLSSVAVVGQGRPSLGDAHDQFFYRNRRKCHTSVKAQQQNVGNLRETETRTMWYKYGGMHSGAVTITRSTPTLGGFNEYEHSLLSELIIREANIVIWLFCM